MLIKKCITMKSIFVLRSQGSHVKLFYPGQIQFARFPENVPEMLKPVCGNISTQTFYNDEVCNITSSFPIRNKTAIFATLRIIILFLHLVLIRI